MSPIEEYGARFGPRYKWWATITVMIGTIVTIAASTMVNVALPDVMGAFGVGEDQVQWLSTAFLAAMTATMLLTAWAIDKIGHRLAFVGALAMFMVGSIGGALADTFAEVIVARVLQGIASGLIQPLAMVVMSEVFPASQRGRAMGIFGIGIVLSPAVGPTFGGWLVDEYSWRFVFMAIVPVTALAIATAAVFLPGRDRSERPPSPFDGFGFLFLVSFLLCLLSGLSNGQRAGWNSDLILALFAGAAISGVAFIGWEFRCRTPLLDLHVFASGPFSASCFVAFTFGVGIFGSTYIVPMFVQLVQGYTATRAGLLLMPAGLVLGVIFPLAGALSDRVPAWQPVLAGLAIFGLSNWYCCNADIDTPFWTFAWWVALGRIGSGLITPGAERRRAARPARRDAGARVGRGELRAPTRRRPRRGRDLRDHRAPHRLPWRGSGAGAGPRQSGGRQRDAATHPDARRTGAIRSATGWPAARCRRCRPICRPCWSRRRGCWPTRTASCSSPCCSSVTLLPALLMPRKRPT